MPDYLEALELLGPLVVAILTQPILALLLQVEALRNGLPNWAKQLSALAIAYGLTLAGQALNVALPLELALFTGADIEALVSAAIAFGIADRKRAKDETGLRVTATGARLLLLVGLFAVPSSAAAQASDSVVVEVVDRSALRAIITTDASRLRGVPGDTVTFEAVIVDLNGDTVAAGPIRWTSNTPAVQIDAETGFATFSGGCGAAICRATVFADVAEFIGAATFSSYPDGAWRLVTAEGDVLQDRFDVEPIDYVLPGRECLAWDFATGVPDGAGGWARLPDCQVEAAPVRDVLCVYLLSRSETWYRSSDGCPSVPPGLAEAETPQPFPLPIWREGARVG